MLLGRSGVGSRWSKRGVYDQLLQRWALALPELGLLGAEGGLSHAEAGAGSSEGDEGSVFPGVESGDEVLELCLGLG